jgi:cbb3-type cytochrome oxidase maturation protein
MDILYLLIPLSVVLALAIGAAFWWAVRHDQFEDLEGPAHRLLLDDDDRVGSDRPGTPATAASGRQQAGRPREDA